MERFLKLKTFSICERKEIIDSVVFNIDHIEDLWGKDCINNITNTVSNDIVQNLIYFKNSDSNSAESVIRDIITRELIIAKIIINIINILFFKILWFLTSHFNFSIVSSVLKSLLNIGFMLYLNVLNAYRINQNFNLFQLI